ncbi:MAG: amino acid ABC transporter permease [Desulfovibrio sp.]
MKKQITLQSLFDIVKYIITIGGLCWFVAYNSQQLGYNWQWYMIPRHLYSITDSGFESGPLLSGLWVTIQISIVSFFCSFTFGLVAALLKLSSSTAGKLLSNFYVESIRNTPLLVQIFFMYFVLAPILDMEAFTAAVLALSLFEGAYASEILRAGVESVPQGQLEAAKSLGMSTPQAYIKVILPQALKNILPPLTSQGASLIKDSALVSTIAIYDLTMQGQAIIAETFLTFEIWFTVAAIYLLLTVTLSVMANFFEHRTPAVLKN